MATEHCPECGEDIKPRAKSCTCGWRSVPKPKAEAIAAADRNRCAWMANGERCRYLGTISGNALGERFCRGHYSCLDAAFGQRVVAESIERVDSQAEYSSAAIIEATISAFLNRPVR